MKRKSRVSAIVGMVLVSSCLAITPAPMLAAGNALHRSDGRPTAAASQTTLAQSPIGLQQAVRSALGGGPASVPGALQQGKLTASDGVTGDNAGYSVALAGSTAVVGAPYKSSNMGAAYVFVLSGTTWGQQAELNAPDGAVSDQFGTSVAISGSTVLVGAPGKDSLTGTASGAAYIFVRSGTSWSEQAKLVATDSSGGDRFGTSVAIAGTTAVVGAPFEHTQTGVAYVFVRSATTWSQQAKLTAPDGVVADFFGDSVAVSGSTTGSTVVVGAAPHSSNSGAAYVFVRSGRTWSEQAELTASDASPGDQFGISVAVSGAILVVGAQGKNSHTGAAYVFVRSGTIWSQQAVLAASDAAALDRFGWSVGISGFTAVVGAYGKNSSAGAGYVFVGSGKVWPQETELTPSDSAAGDNFGAAVSISGSTVLVGAPAKGAGAAYVYATPAQQAHLTASDGAIRNYFGHSVSISGATAVVGAWGRNGNTGAAYVFLRVGSSWSLQAELTASDRAPSTNFGWSVAISGSTLVVGAPLTNASTSGGAAYVFVRSGTTWSQQAELTASDRAPFDEFGSSVAVSGSYVVVGAPDRNSLRGAAYVFTSSGATWSQQAELTASDGATGDWFGWSVAVSGSTALVGATAYGDTSRAGAAYAFVRSGATWSQQSEITASDSAIGDEFGGSVALAGSTAVVGAVRNGSVVGAVYVFVQSGPTWSQQAELTPSDSTPSDRFGGAVAISGSTVVVGAEGKNSNAGAAYEFAGSGNSWPQIAELSSYGAPSSFFGNGVAISGPTAIIGASGNHSFTGAAYAFVL